MKASTIVNCYWHVQILPSQEEFDDDDDDVPLSRLQFSSEEDKEDDIPLVDLQRKMRLLPDTGSMTAEEYLAVDEEDEEEETGQQLKDVDIMFLVSRERWLSASNKKKKKKCLKISTCKRETSSLQAASITWSRPLWVQQKKRKGYAVKHWIFCGRWWTWWEDDRPVSSNRRRWQTFSGSDEIINFSSVNNY